MKNYFAFVSASAANGKLYPSLHFKMSKHLIIKINIHLFFFTAYRARQVCSFL